MASERIDSLVHQLSLAEKIEFLFVDRPDSDKPDSLVLARHYKIFDTRKGMSDSLVFPYPNEWTIRAAADEGLANKLFEQSCKDFSIRGYDGIVVPSLDTKVGCLYARTGKGMTSEHYFRLIDFPYRLFDEALKIGVSGLKSPIGKEVINAKELGFPTLGIWSKAVWFDMSPNELMHHNLLFWDEEGTNYREVIRTAVNAGYLSEELLNDKVKQLMALMGANEPCSEVPLVKGNAAALRKKAFEASVSGYQKRMLFPLTRLDTLNISLLQATTTNSDRFVDRARFYLPAQSICQQGGHIQFILSDDEEQLENCLQQLPADSSEVSQYKVVIFVGRLNKALLTKMATEVDAFFLMPEHMQYSWEMMAQAVFNGIAVEGKANQHDEFIRNNFERLNLSRSRLGFSVNASVVLSPDSVAKIDSIVYDAIRRQATPGAQLLVAKDGEVLLQKSYGYHTYKKYLPVKDSDLYDVASVTKLAVTFPLVMQLYDQGTLNLDAALKEYIPDIDTTDKANITVKELLVHQSGLVSYIPFHTNALDRESLRKRPLYSRHYSRIYNLRVDTRLYQNKQARFRKEIFSNEVSEVFNRQLTGNMFMNQAYVDSMYAAIYSSTLNKKKEYRYSDLGYYLLQKIFEREEGESLDSLYYRRVASPLGADKLLYKPLKRYTADALVPTENDMAFRKTLLDGYVHDQGAAMLGGVAAHAGLFANAGDLAKLSQMLLNEGQYGGVRFFKQETLGFFTQTVNHGNRRGLGVDKPELSPSENSHVSRLASPSSYGHTGFTGTIVWIDPEHELIYIFLSNRIHPHAYNKKLIEMNVRTKIQDVIYNSMEY